MIGPIEVEKIVKAHAPYLQLNHEFIDIYDNNLGQYIECDLAKQLSPQAFQQAKFRISPINVLPKVIDKLTNIYQTAVLRNVVDGSEQDQETLEWYEKTMQANFQMNTSNEMLNLCNASLIYPCVREGKPSLMVIENDCFIAYSDDPMNPTKPTHIIMLAGKDPNDENLDLYWTWSADQFFVSDSRGDLRLDQMARFQNPDGVNPIGRLPFVYVNSSKRRIMPKQDCDMLKIIKLIPVIFSDLNFAAMFQCFSILYGIDVDDKGIEFAPNAFWSFKSDPSTDKKPEIGSIKPDVDYAQVLQLIETQLSIWLGTKGIKASSIGGMEKDNFASGISKMIDEMDTYEARQYQVGIYQNVERELWDLILNYMHPYWVSTGQLFEVYSWTTGKMVETKFAVQLSMQSRGQIVRDVKEEYAAGFISKKRAIERINPEMTEHEIDELLSEIETERTLRIQEVENAGQTAENNSGDSQGINSDAAA